ncbi:Uncharacterized protein FWK35_00028488 [Aphis craccivora]|uniref:ATP-dependent DNA helicase PIF1-like n=1 Tax=Aphis craccivora TaxID=307492 RepID=A0A6G0WDN2_APHCR|nr:Uncharacterized protein FWK35_00028488 [Aphis craccivora]
MVNVIEFPIRLAFAMTINKSQGQKVCDLNLCTPCFSHGQLYVAYSQVGKPSSLFVLKFPRNNLYGKTTFAGSAILYIHDGVSIINHRNHGCSF